MVDHLKASYLKKLRKARTPEQQELIQIQFAFEKAMLSPSEELKAHALNLLAKQKYPEDNRQQLLQFFIKKQVFTKFENLPYENVKGNPVLHVMGSYLKNSINYGALVFFTALAASPLLVAASLVSGIFDLFTRNPLDSKSTASLFSNLGKITDAGKQEFIDKIIESNSQRGLSFSSTSSKNLIDSLSSSKLNLKEKWSSLLRYVTDVEKKQR